MRKILIVVFVFGVVLLLVFINKSHFNLSTQPNNEDTSTENHLSVHINKPELGLVPDKADPVLEIEPINLPVIDNVDNSDKNIPILNLKSQLFNEDDSFDFITAIKTLERKDFDSFLIEVASDNSEESVAKYQELSEQLYEITGLNSNNVEHACGFDICVVRVKFVEKNQYNKMSDDVSNLANNVSFSSYVKGDDGYLELRVIFGSKPNKNNTITLPPETPIN